MIFADVIIDISVKSLDRPFQYIVPEEMEFDVDIGSVVKIPFGMGNRTMTGYVVGLSGEAKFDISKTKSILEIIKQGVVVESHLLSLAYWIKENYGSTMNDAIKSVMPVKREIKEQIKRVIYPAVSMDKMREKRDEFEKKHNKARVRLLDEFLKLDKTAYNAGLDYSYATKKLSLTASVIEGLRKLDIITVDAIQQYRNPIGNIDERPEVRPVLNREQKHTVDSILNDYIRDVRGTYLIHGITGSGKTEVYLNIVEKVICLGKQAIVLIPEISLTFQMVNRFYKRFGNRISVMHSRLSAGERFDQYTRAKNGEIDVMIGPRSALFTPFQNLGLIVIDEEHDSSYQSEMPPKYHAREVAIQRAKMVGASVVLGSATPSVDSYYKAMQGEYRLFELNERAGNAVYPSVYIEDLREELKAKNYSIFSRRLDELMRDRLEKKEQIMLFLNRRGFAGFVSCRQCGEVLGCPHCSVALKPHSVNGRVSYLMCHYCGYKIQMPDKCPSCGSLYISSFGIGTQQVEQMVKKRFPQADVLRMDADTTTGKNAHENILKEYSKGGADILIGTQMIVKGHDFANVTLVGIIAADLSLNSGDYRAAEKTFQLTTQACGRAGRADKPGEVVIQTYTPDNYSVEMAAKQDYIGFYNEEILYRQLMEYPPVLNMLKVSLSSKKEDELEEVAEYINLNHIQFHGDNITVYAPVNAGIYKINDIYTKFIYAKSQSYEVLTNFKDELEKLSRDNILFKNINIQFDFN